jgi:putative Mn2+ efflux pump MntP
MSFGAILLLSVGLAMDATAVAAARGVASTRILMRDVLLIGGLFGAFQGLMPLVGWLIGSRIGPYAQAFDHWIAFGVLAGIGGKMLWEARRGADEAPSAARPGLHVLVMLAIATSIDALAVGFTLPMLNAPMGLSLWTIGVTTALLSGLGLLAGKRLGAALGSRFDVFGGLLLIGFGVKILVEHLTA